jgi:hypothetical protein
MEKQDAIALLVAAQLIGKNFSDEQLETQITVAQRILERIDARLEQASGSN